VRPTARFVFATEPSLLLQPRPRTAKCYP